MAADAVFDPSRTRAAFVRNGDIFIREVASRRLIQVTRTAEPESAPQFSADGRSLQFRSGSDWYSYDIAGGVGGPAVIVRTEKDPEAKKPDDLGEMQLRYFSTLRKIKADREAQKHHGDEFAKGDPTRAPQPFFIGDDVKIEETALAPDARHLLIVTTPKGYDRGRRGKLQQFVTDSGYEEQEDERTRVGRNVPAPQSLLLLDLVQHEQHKLAFDDLAGMHDDPLKAVREENEKLKRERGIESKEEKHGDDKAAQSDSKKKDDKADDKSKPRAVRIVADAEDGGGGGIAWSKDGRSLAIQLRAIDNKDRWIATVDFDKSALVLQQRLRDAGWINWNFNDFGWENDNQTLWYLSEETGYSQLYAKKPGGKANALTSGKFEVSSPTLSADGRWFYLRANAEAPYAYDVYRVAAGGGKFERVTNYKGMNAFALSPDGKQLVVLHSSPYVPAQLAVTAAESGAAPRELTDTRSSEYKALAWPDLQVVEVPSSHTQQPIYAKVYKPKDFDASKKYPAVLFVHGAGYLQNVTLGYSPYFREQMFNNLLTEHGYVVLDMGLPRQRRLRPRLAYRDLSPDGPSGAGRPDRRRALAGEERRGRSAACRLVRRLLRRLHVADGAVPRARRVQGRRRAAPGHRLDPVQPRIHREHPQRPATRPDRLRGFIADRIRRRPQRRPADLPRHDRQQRAVRRFGAAVPEADRAAQGQFPDVDLSDGAAWFRACGFLAG